MFHWFGLGRFGNLVSSLECLPKSVMGSTGLIISQMSGSRMLENISVGWVLGLESNSFQLQQLGGGLLFQVSACSQKSLYLKQRIPI